MQIKSKWVFLPKNFLKQNQNEKCIEPKTVLKVEYKCSIVLPRLQKKKKPVDFDDELRIGDVRYKNMI